MGLSPLSFPDYGRLTHGMNLPEIVKFLREVGFEETAAQIEVLNMRLKKLAMTPTTADKIDFEQYLAWDIIQTIRRVTKCPIEKAIVEHCEELMVTVRRAVEVLGRK